MKACMATIFDDGYSEQAAVLIQSISDNYMSLDVLEIVCIVPERDYLAISEKLVKWLKVKTSINILFRQVSDSFGVSIDGIDCAHWGTNTTWYRLYLGSILHDYNKVILLDADMLVVRDVQPIIDYPMYNKIMATPDLSGSEITVRGMRDQAVFMAGMFIADLDWWRDSNVESDLTNYVLNNPTTILADDQPLNVCLRHVWSPLPIVFNYFYFKTHPEYGYADWDDPLLPVHHKDVLIIHFNGETKPWNSMKKIGKEDTSSWGMKWKEFRDRVCVD